MDSDYGSSITGTDHSLGAEIRGLHSEDLTFRHFGLRHCCKLWVANRRHQLREFSKSVPTRELGFGCEIRPI